MRHPERVEDYLEHVVQAIQRATEYIDRLGNVDAFRRSQRDQDAVIRNIEVVGEAASRIQRSAPEFVVTHPELPWIEMRRKSEPGRVSVCGRTVRNSPLRPGGAERVG